MKSQPSTAPRSSSAIAHIARCSSSRSCSFLVSTIFFSSVILRHKLRNILNATAQITTDIFFALKENIPFSFQPYGYICRKAVLLLWLCVRYIFLSVNGIFFYNRPQRHFSIILPIYTRKVYHKSVSFSICTKKYHSIPQLLLLSSLL